MADRTPTCEQVRLLDGTPTLIRHGHGVEEPCPFDRASAEGLREAVEEVIAAWEREPVWTRDDVIAGLRAALRDTGPRPDRADREGTADVAGVHHDDAADIFGGPRPDSGIDVLTGRIRESLDANNAFEYDDPINGVMTGFDGNKDVLAEAIAADLLASTPRTETSE